MNGKRATELLKKLIEIYLDQEEYEVAVGNLRLNKGRML